MPSRGYEHDRVWSGRRWSCKIAQVSEPVRGAITVSGRYLCKNSVRLVGVSVADSDGTQAQEEDQQALRELAWQRRKLAAGVRERTSVSRLANSQIDDLAETIDINSRLVSE